MQRGLSGDNLGEMSKKVYWKIGVILVLLLLVVVLVLQNRQEVPIHLLFYTLVLPNAAALTITFCLGFLLGVLMMFLARAQGREEPVKVPTKKEESSSSSFPGSK